jgi:hypothetical protein
VDETAVVGDLSVEKGCIQRSLGISVMASTPSRSSAQKRSGVDAPPGKRQASPITASGSRIFSLA